MQMQPFDLIDHGLSDISIMLKPFKKHLPTQQSLTLWFVTQLRGVWGDVTQ